MSNQKWADAATQNCVWLLQSRDLPSCAWEEVDEDETEFDHESEDGDKYRLNDEHFTDEQCWRTEGVFLNRLEAFEAGARRVYNYGQYGKDWRIYGVPAHGELVELLAKAGVNQEHIDNNVKQYEQERPLWEEKDDRLVDLELRELRMRMAKQKEKYGF